MKDEPIVTDLNRLEEKAMRHVKAGRWGGKSFIQQGLVYNYLAQATAGGAGKDNPFVTAGTLIHDEFMTDWSAPSARPTKREKPWKKGFIPTVGKRPELPAPHISGWETVSRDGAVVTYARKGETSPFMVGLHRLVANLVTRRWELRRRIGTPWGTGGFETILHASRVDACLVLAELEKEPTVSFGFDTGRSIGGMVDAVRYLKP